jgi:acyl-CoA thioester hydrolase
MRTQSKQYVRWGDLDAFGHVNNATYLGLRPRSSDTQWSKMFEMVVARAEVDFIAPIYVR